MNNFAVTDERLACLREAKPFAKLATSRKRKDTKAAQAEFRAQRRQDIHMRDWEGFLDKFLRDTELPVLIGRSI